MARTSVVETRAGPSTFRFEVVFAFASFLLDQFDTFLLTLLLL